MNKRYDIDALKRRAGLEPYKRLLALIGATDGPSKAERSVALGQQRTVEFRFNKLGQIAPTHQPEKVEAG